MTNEELYATICNKIGINYNEAINKTKLRSRKFNESRQIYFYIKKRHTYETLEEIGKFLNKDHSTVIHSVKRIDELIRFDKNFLYFMNSLILSLDLEKKEVEYINVTMTKENYELIPNELKLKIKVNVRKNDI